MKYSQECKPAVFGELSRAAELAEGWTARDKFTVQFSAACGIKYSRGRSGIARLAAR